MHDIDIDDESQIYAYQSETNHLFQQKMFAEDARQKKWLPFFGISGDVITQDGEF